jgi:hypothetical protein
LTDNITLYARWNAPFTITFQTTTDSEDILLPVSTCIDSNFACGTQEEYDWTVEWEPDVSTSESGESGAEQGISHTYPNAGTHTIHIYPNSDIDGWFRAFGFSYGNAGPDATTNKTKVIQISGVITKHMLGITDETNSAYAFMFSDLPNLTMANDFNIDQSITGSVGDYFATNMFYGCSGGSFTMGPNFNLPPNITQVGDYFALGMFQACNGDNFTVSERFNLPQGITAAGSFFATGMFYNCSGSAFTMGDNFNLPQNITIVGMSFANNMFYLCSGENFKVAQNFRFSLLTEEQLNQSGVYNQVFAGVTNTQEVAATLIINGNSNPDIQKNTFSDSFSDYSSIYECWREVH